jgi:hypothetical protein
MDLRARLFFSDEEAAAAASRYRSSTSIHLERAWKLWDEPKTVAALLQRAAAAANAGTMKGKAFAQATTTRGLRTAGVAMWRAARRTLEETTTEAPAKATGSWLRAHKGISKSSTAATHPTTTARTKREGFGRAGEQDGEEWCRPSFDSWIGMKVLVFTF